MQELWEVGKDNYSNNCVMEFKFHEIKVSIKNWKQIPPWVPVTTSGH